MGVVVDAAEFALWVSPHLVGNTERVLSEALGWEPDSIKRFVSVVVAAAEHSGGGLVDPPKTVTDCPDWEDNRVLDLAMDVGALLVVSDDVDLTSMSPWRGTPILRPREFTAKVDAMRRQRRRRS